jgi:hypothetical protein
MNTHACINILTGQHSRERCFLPPVRITLFEFEVCIAILNKTGMSEMIEVTGTRPSLIDPYGSDGYFCLVLGIGVGIGCDCGGRGREAESFGGGVGVIEYEFDVYTLSEPSIDCVSIQTDFMAKLQDMHTKTPR